MRQASEEFWRTGFDGLWAEIGCSRFSHAEGSLKVDAAVATYRVSVLIPSMIS